MKKTDHRLALTGVAILMAASATAGTSPSRFRHHRHPGAEVGRGVHGQASEVKIQVSGGGSGIGFAALQDQSTDIADASRPIKPRSRRLREGLWQAPTEYKIAVDGLSVYVNKENRSRN